MIFLPSDFSTLSPKSDKRDCSNSSLPPNKNQSLHNSKEIDGDWNFLLAEALSLAPWSPEASRFVDAAIAAREGQAGTGIALREINFPSSTGEDEPSIVAQIR